METIVDVNNVEASALENVLRQYLHERSEKVSDVKWDKEEEITGEIKSGSQKGFIKFVEEEPAGFILFKEHGSNLVIVHFFVLSQFRNHRVGESLLEKIKCHINEKSQIQRITLALFPGLAGLSPEILALLGFKSYERFVMEKTLDEAIEPAPLTCDLSIHNFETAYLWQLSELLHMSSKDIVDRYIRPGILDTPWTCYMYIKQIMSNYYGVFNSHTSLVISEGKIAVGAIFCTFRLNGETFIPAFFVHPEYQGRGIGRILLTHLLSKLKKYGTQKVCLCVSRENKRAYSLYIKSNFSVAMKYYEVLYSKEVSL